MERSTLFSNEQTGRITCYEHGGGYLRHAVADTPHAWQWWTPLGDIVQLNALDLANWLEMTGEPMTCEDCTSIADVVTA